LRCRRVQHYYHSLLKTMLKSLSLLLLSGLLLASCTDDPATPSNSSFTANFINLEDVGPNARYEGWLIVNGQPISTGVFSVNSAGVPSSSTFNASTNNLSAATAFVLTVEPFPDNDPMPSQQKILAGTFDGKTAAVNTSHMMALGQDFSTAKGTYILATPTDGNMDMNETSGVWWIDPSGGTMKPGFILPTLPPGWTYEGWTVVNGKALSTGKFNKVDSMDMSRVFSGSAATGPNFPGEDLLMNPPSGQSFPKMLEGMSKVVLTIEPVPDNDVKPFGLKPLAHDVPSNAMAHTPFMMMNQAASMPTGTITR
jgi:hypothetical protein